MELLKATSPGAPARPAAPAIELPGLAAPPVTTGPTVPPIAESAAPDPALPPAWIPAEPACVSPAPMASSPPPPPTSPAMVPIRLSVTVQPTLPATSNRTNARAFGQRANLETRFRIIAAGIPSAQLLDRDGSD